MNEPVMLVVAASAGLGLGGLFFGGLWWTVRNGVSSPQPALWFFFSLPLRMGIVLAGFHVVGGGQWERLMACLFGFVLARVLVVRLTNTQIERVRSPAEEASRAP